MTSILQGERVLRHLEEFLGSATLSWSRVGEDALPFQVLLFPECPELDGQSLVTYGLSAHPLRIIGKNDSDFRMEFAICADSTFDSRNLVALLIAVGLKTFERLATPGAHEVIAGEGAILTNPVFEHFYLTFPGYFPTEFELCETVFPPVAIIQLIPISSKERELIMEKGWRFFEQTIVEQGIDLLKFDRRRELIF